MKKGKNLRSEIEDKLKWDLESIYSDYKDWEDEYQFIKKEITKFSKYKNKIFKSDNLISILKLYDNIDRVVLKLYVYAAMKNDEDTTNNFYQSLRGKIDNLVSEFGEKTSFIVPELLKKDYKEILKLYETTPELKDYEFKLYDIYRFKNHTLSKKEESLLSSFSKNFNFSNKLYSYLINSDMRFGTIKDEKKEEVELTNSNYGIYISSKDRRVRKEAFNKLYDTYESMKNTLSVNYFNNIDTEVTVAKLRGYKSALEMSLYANNINMDIYDNLIKTVNENMSIIYKYYDLIKKVTNLDELHLYDVYVDIVEESDKKYSFEEAKEIIINALSILGEDYKKNLTAAFEQKWIDVYPNKGKKSGAYSWGCYDTYPFILLNYEGKLDDVFTLAHELGHSLHSFYSIKNNPYHEYQYEIFVAEVASTVNEMLLFRYLLNNAETKKEKLYILSHFLKMFRATLYRQTMFAEFEKTMHELVEKGEILTNDLIETMYYHLNEKYFGKNVIVDDKIKYEWSRIPHFYNNFYVYQYATGISAATYIAKNIMEKNDYKENYLKFLTTGGSNYPVELLKIAKVDINKPEVIESAIKLFDEMIDEFIQIYSSRE